MWSPSRQGKVDDTTIIGEAVTVKVGDPLCPSIAGTFTKPRCIKMVEASDTTSPKLATHFADSNEAGKIMYIHQPQGMYSACFGGLMAARSKYLGAAGTVINGRFRDIGEIQEMGFPVPTSSQGKWKQAKQAICSSLPSSRQSWDPVDSREPPKSTYRSNSREIYGSIPATSW